MKGTKRTKNGANRALTRPSLCYNIVLTMSGKTQKVQKVGNSFAILLPKEWAREQALKAGSEVRVETTETRLTVLPKRKARKLKVTPKFAKEVDEFLEKNRRILERLS